MEVKAKELRIGNWVRFEYGGTDCSDVQINTNYFRHYEIEGYVSRPIPLTEEWLVKFGFKDLSSDKNGFGLRIEINISDELCWYKQDDVLRYQTKRNGFTRNFNIKHVHQLQNLYFALTGEELTIKVEA